MKIQIIITMDITKKYYKEYGIETKREIESGKYQRQITADARKFKKGINKVSATFKKL